MDGFGEKDRPGLVRSLILTGGYADPESLEEYDRAVECLKEYRRELALLGKAGDKI